MTPMITLSRILHFKRCGSTRQTAPLKQHEQDSVPRPAPEMVVRQMVTKLGYRYRLHVTALPGTPDIVFRRRKCAIFVHGCFWHQHDNCREGRIPHSRTDYWAPKLRKNVERDLAHMRALIEAGWRVM